MRRARVVARAHRGALASYWVYQHIGNLAPGSHADDELLAARQVQADDAWPILAEFAQRADRSTDGTRGATAATWAARGCVVIDSRAGRVLEEGRRSMLDERSGSGSPSTFEGDFDHLLVATSLPWLLGAAMHYVEAWSEAVAGGAWGRAWPGSGERLRRAGGPGALARVPGVLRAAGRAGALGRGGRARPRRRPPSCCCRATSTTPTSSRSRSRAGRRALARVPGGLLALPQPARARERQVHPDGALAARTGGRAGAGGQRRGRGPDVRWRMVGRRPLVRQPGGHPPHRRPRRSRCAWRRRCRWTRLRPPRAGARSQARLRPQLRAPPLVLAEL